MKNSKRITEIEKNIKEMKEEIAKQEKLIAKLKNNEYEIGDIVIFGGFEWYVIDVVCDLLTLMVKNTVINMAYSDEKSNDYHDSNVKKYLEENFINAFCKNDLINLMEMVTNYDEGKVETTLVRIPTLREIERLPKDVRKCGDDYLTMTASFGSYDNDIYTYVFGVNSSGDPCTNSVEHKNGVRPVIKIRKDSLNE